MKKRTLSNAFFAAGTGLSSLLLNGASCPTVENANIPQSAHVVYEQDLIDAEEARNRGEADGIASELYSFDLDPNTWGPFAITNAPSVTLHNGARGGSPPFDATYTVNQESNAGRSSTQIILTDNNNSYFSGDEFEMCIGGLTRVGVLPREQCWTIRYQEGRSPGRIGDRGNDGHHGGGHDNDNGNNGQNDSTPVYATITFRDKHGNDLESVTSSTDCFYTNVAVPTIHEDKLRSVTFSETGYNDCVDFTAFGNSDGTINHSLDDQISQQYGQTERIYTGQLRKEGESTNPNTNVRESNFSVQTYFGYVECEENPPQSNHERQTVTVNMDGLSQSPIESVDLYAD